MSHGARLGALFWEYKLTAGRGLRARILGGDTLFIEGAGHDPVEAPELFLAGVLPFLGASSSARDSIARKTAWAPNPSPRHGGPLGPLRPPSWFVEGGSGLQWVVVMVAPQLVYVVVLTSVVGSGCVATQSPPIDGVTATTQGDSASTSNGATGETEGGEASDPESATSEPTPSTSFAPDDFGVADACDPWAQDCPEGEKCVPYGSTGGNWDANKCVPLMGNQMVGEPCTWGGLVDATDDCDATSLCWGVNPENVGTCQPFCTGVPDDPMCPPEHICISSEALNVCITTCDPILQDCGEDLACYWANNGFHCIFTDQDIPPGQPCGLINDCEGGNVCLVEEVLPNCLDAACCTPFCDLDAPGSVCEILPGTSCLPFFPGDDAPPGYENVGVCILM